MELGTWNVEGWKTEALGVGVLETQSQKELSNVLLVEFLWLRFKYLFKNLLFEKML